MGDADPGHLVAKERLAPPDLAEIERLVALCQAHDGHSVKLNWRMMRNRPAVVAPHGTVVAEAGRKTSCTFTL